MLITGKTTLAIAAVCTFFHGSIAQGNADLVRDLPGLIFETNFDIYAGYLWADVSRQTKMFYWLTESQSAPDTDPLLLWLSGGPGCSSLGGHFEQMGPFHVNKDGQTLYENVFAWNQKANVLYLDSPIGAGFSYNVTDPRNVRTNDDAIAEQNYQALIDFFIRVQPKFANRTFFISGESYAGVMLPTLAIRLIDGATGGKFPNANFQGMAIGNGFLHTPMLTNSKVLWMHYHGQVAIETWELVKQECCIKENQTNIDECNFRAHMGHNDFIDAGPWSDGTLCGNLTIALLSQPSYQSHYNYYKDCYEGAKAKTRSPAMLAQNSNTAEMLNYDSNDNQNGYPCWQDDAIEKYLNQKAVWNAMHVDENWQNSDLKWDDCRSSIFGNYTVKYTETTDLFNYIIQNTTVKDFRILIYNGDVDTACNFLGCAMFARQVAKINEFEASFERVPWLFRHQIAGFVQRYRKGDLILDVLTVKGGGHFAPNDRPGPTLQMITNFMWWPAGNYSSTNFVNPTPQPRPLRDGGDNAGVSSRNHDSRMLKMLCAIVVFLCLGMQTFSMN